MRQELQELKRQKVDKCWNLLILYLFLCSHLFPKIIICVLTFIRELQLWLILLEYRINGII